MTFNKSAVLAAFISCFALTGCATQQANNNGRYSGYRIVLQQDGKEPQTIQSQLQAYDKFKEQQVLYKQGMHTSSKVSIGSLLTTYGRSLVEITIPDGDILTLEGKEGAVTLAIVPCHAAAYDKNGVQYCKDPSAMPPVSKTTTIRFVPGAAAEAKFPDALLRFELIDQQGPI